MPPDVYELAKRQLLKIYREEGSRAFHRAVMRAWELESALSVLFLPCAPGYGCPTQVRDHPMALPTFETPDPELTQQIRQDQRIPADPVGITVDRLEVFAEYQRLFDERFPRRWEGEGTHLRRVRRMADEFFGSLEDAA